MNPFKAIAKAPGKLINHVNRKVWAATTGAVFAAPIIHIIKWVLTDPQFHIGLQIPDEIAADMENLINVAIPAVGALLGGYIVPERELEDQGIANQNRVPPPTVRGNQ